MKSAASVLVLISTCVAGSSLRAQEDLQQELARERSRIAAERQAADSRYAQAEAACYARFAVNDCLNQAKAARRETLADLRRQEVSLNDDERRRKGAAQQQKLDERMSPANQQKAAQQRARALEDAALREERAARKAAGAPAPATPGPQAPATVTAPAPSAPDASAIRKRQQKLEEAQARKARLEKRRQERTKPPAKPLPVPVS